MSQFTNKNDRRKAASKAGDAKANRRMGRLLAERRYDNASGEAISAPVPRTSELVVTTTKTGVIIPLSRVGQGAPDTDLITDVMKAMSR